MNEKTQFEVDLEKANYPEYLLKIQFLEKLRQAAGERYRELDNPALITNSKEWQDLHVKILEDPLYSKLIEILIAYREHFRI